MIKIMEKTFLKFFFLIGCIATLLFTSCEPEVPVTGSLSPLISIEDIRIKYADSPIELKRENMLGATHICGIVVSDPLNGNAPDGLVIVQGYRRKQLRGIALQLGDAAVQYNAGDSVVVKVEGTILDRVEGVLQLTGLTESAITKISTGNEQKINLVTGTFSAIINKMNTYESTLVQLRQAIAQNITAGQTFVGDIELYDGGTSIMMYTKATASFADEPVPKLGAYTGIILSNSQAEPSLWLRSSNDYEEGSLDPYTPNELYVNFPESFENPLGTRKGGYTTGTQETYATGEWLMSRCYTLSSANLTGKTGTWAIMMQNAQISVLTMNFNLVYGASKFSFDYGAATATDTNLPITMKVEYSQDSGNTWQQLEELLVVTNTAKQTKEYILDLNGPVRFRISKDNAAARAFIDNIAIYQN
jgi:hypothetical protein